MGIAVFFLSTMFVTINAFVAPMSLSRQQRSHISMQADFDGIKEVVQNSVESGTPLLEDAAALNQNFLVHWGHGTAMGTVLVTMALTGE